MNLLRSLLILFTSLLLRLLWLPETGRGREFIVLARCTPVVWTGGPRLDKFPNKSVKPPSADKLVSALSAPGFESNWANGIAEANALWAASVALFVVDDCEPAVFAAPAGVGVVDALVGGLPFVEPAPDCSCDKFAFCNSTLLRRR